MKLHKPLMVAALLMIVAVAIGVVAVDAGVVYEVDIESGLQRERWNVFGISIRTHTIDTQTSRVLREGGYSSGEHRWRREGEKSFLPLGGIRQYLHTGTSARLKMLQQSLTLMDADPHERLTVTIKAIEVLGRGRGLELEQEGEELVPVSKF